MTRIASITFKSKPSKKLSSIVEYLSNIPIDLKNYLLTEERYLHSKLKKYES